MTTRTRSLARSLARARALVAAPALALALVLLVSPAPASAGGSGPRVAFLEDGFLEVHGFIQPRFQSVVDAPEGQEQNLADFSLKRIKLIFKGQIWKNLGFFVTPVVLGLGAGGDFTPRVAISDAWLEYRFGKWLKVDAGILKLPFARHMQLSGGKIHGLDFHGYMLGRVVGDETKAGIVPHRDIGVMARGILFGTWLDYRLALLDGREPGGERDAPRIMGRVGVNIFDDEPEYMWNDAYFGKRTILTLGASFDLQPGVAGADGEDLFYAVALDAHADIPLGDHVLVATAVWHYMGPPIKLAADAKQKAMPEGMGAWGEVGFMVFRHYEPLIAVEWYDPKEGDKGKRLGLIGGFNWWIKGHTFNIKTQYGAYRLNGLDDWSHTVTLQGQVAF